jgi:hypothetical protein
MSYIVADIRVNYTYKCSACKRKELGTSDYISLTVSDASTIADVIHNNEKFLKSANMPVGWCYSGKFICQSCK